VQKQKRSKSFWNISQLALEYQHLFAVHDISSEFFFAMNVFLEHFWNIFQLDHVSTVNAALEYQHLIAVNIFFDRPALSLSRQEKARR